MIRPSPHLVVSPLSCDPTPWRGLTNNSRRTNHPKNKTKQTNNPSICVGQIAATDQRCSSPSNDSIEAKAKRQLGSQWEAWAWAMCHTITQRRRQSLPPRGCCALPLVVPREVECSRS